MFSFQVGDKIEVLSQISEDWLYGQLGSEAGQFPTTFVDRVPHNLPKYEAEEKKEAKPKQVRALYLLKVVSQSASISFLVA